MKAFASDNYSSVCPEVILAIQQANLDHAPAYGNDIYTEKALMLLKKAFGDKAQAYFVYNGTAANTLGLKTMLQSHEAILCADSAHILSHEVGSVFHAIGCNVIPVPNIHGKLFLKSLEEVYKRTVYWGRHQNKPKVVSISATEFGTVILSQLQEIAAFANHIVIITYGWLSFKQCRSQFKHQSDSVDS